jgi:hypothetical protein
MNNHSVGNLGFSKFCLALLVALLTSCSGQNQTPNSPHNPPTNNPPGGVTFARMQGFGVGGGASLELDPQGGVSVAYSGSTSGELWFAHCASACDQTANWKLLKLSADGVFGSNPVLQLDSNGNPRIVWIAFGGLNPNEVLYLECNTHCTDSFNNWKFVTVTDADTNFYQYAASKNPTFFALDKQGRPGIVNYEAGMLQYVSCQATCIQAGNWQLTNLTPPQAGSRAFHASLVFSSSGLPRVAATLADANVNVSLLYFECGKNCSSSSSWTDTNVVPLGTWLLYFAGPLLNNPDSNKLFYSACDGNCTEASNWRRATISVPDGSGNTGLDLALDPNNTPHLVYDTRRNNDPVASGTLITNTQLEYAVCSSSDCAANPTWTRTVVEDGIQQSADPGLRDLYKAQCRYGIDVDPLLEPLFSLVIFVGQQAHLVLGASDQPFISADYAPTFNCGDGQIRTGGMIPTVYLPR